MSETIEQKSSNALRAQVEEAAAQVAELEQEQRNGRRGREKATTSGVTDGNTNDR